MTILNAELSGEVEPELTSILLGNLVYTDNNLLPSHSNTRTGWAAVPVVELVQEQAIVALSSREVAD